MPHSRRAHLLIYCGLRLNRSGRDGKFNLEKEELNTLFCFQFVTLKTFCSNADMKDSNKHTCWVCVCKTMWTKVKHVQSSKSVRLVCLNLTDWKIKL